MTEVDAPGNDMLGSHDVFFQYDDRHGGILEASRVVVSERKHGRRAFGVSRTSATFQHLRDRKGTNDRIHSTGTVASMILAD